MNSLKMDHTLHLMDLSQEIEGFRNFISSWVVADEYTFLVDIGPASTVEDLVKSLKALGITRLDYVLLTHIHIDHAGGVGDFIKHFPETKIVCHERAIHHLLNPENLWKATKSALGEIAVAYGEMKPVPAQNIIPSHEFQEKGFQSVTTPGHAIHHVSYIFNTYLFAGEVCGVFHSLENETYQRPATPPKFYLEEAVSSIDTLLNFEKKKLCFGHFGMHNDSNKILARHRKQIFLWRDIIGLEMEKPLKKGDLIENCLSRLLERDPLFSPYHHLDSDIQKRERYFLKNSIEGFIGYINSTAR